MPEAHGTEERSPDITYRHVRAFLAAVEQPSLSVAAKQLNVSHSALSRAIGDLEDMLGVSCFDRTPRGMHLSEAGRAFLPHAQCLAELYAAPLCPTVDMERLVLASSPVVTNLVLPSLLRRSHASLIINEYSSHEIPQQILAGRAHVGLCMLPAPPEGLHCMRLLRVPLGLVARADTALPEGVQNLAALAGLPLARLGDDMVLPSALRASGVSFPAYFSAPIVTNSMQALFSAVAQGQLSTLMSAIATFDAPGPPLRFIPLPALLPPLYLCLLEPLDSEREPDPRRARFVAAIRSAIHDVAWPQCVERL